jgi:hypothetical protein
MSELQMTPAGRCARSVFSPSKQVERVFRVCRAENRPKRRLPSKLG